METRIPLSLIKSMLNLIPRQIIHHIVDRVWSRMEYRHTKLIKNLGLLNDAVIHLDPTDIPYIFKLSVGSDVSFSILNENTENPDALISGKLEYLVNMLEGREDGDALFFSRDIQIEGDTETIVGLRNTLDREEIDLFTEIFSLLGPFARQANATLNLFGKFKKAS